GRRAVAMMQNSGLGNAVSPLTSLSHVFRIPTLLIVTHRGAPGLKDEPQHALMGPITERMLRTMEVPCEVFPQEPEAIAPALERAEGYMEREGRPYALLMKKGTVAPHPLRRQAVPAPAGERAGVRRLERGRPPTRREALERVLAGEDGRTVVIATTGYTGRELYALEDRPCHLYMVGSMGCASSLGLGLALARPDLRVVVVDGDGAALMRMGNFATLGAYHPPNLVHLLLDNGVHDSTGAQATVSAHVDFAGVARACGYRTILAGDDPALIDRLLAGEGLRFGHLRTIPGTIEDLPRPAITPEQVRSRLMEWIDTRHKSEGH
ncbi:MAG: phosphonopyruvate decarboxylase, partial [Gammaproteobacteria bacterium]